MQRCLRRLTATGLGEMAPKHILSSRAHTDKIPTATPMFLRSSFLVGVLRFVERQYVLEIQDGSQIAGSSNISETVTYIIKIRTANLRH